MAKPEDDSAVERCVEFFTRWKEDQLETEDFYKARDEAITRVLKVPSIAGNLAWEDVVDILHNVVPYTGKGLLELTRGDLEQYVRSRLLRRQPYTVVFPLYGLFEFPAHTKIGPAEVVVFEDLPQPIREAFESSWSFEFERRPGLFRNIEEFLEDRKNCVFLRLAVEGGGFRKVAQKSAALVEDALCILRAIYDHPFPISELVALGADSTMMSQQYESAGWMRYVPALADEIGYWTEILTKANPNDLEGRMGRAYRLYGLSRTLERPELRFILLAVGLETLLLGKDDKDYLRYKLSEKAAFLIAETEEDRIRTNAQLKAIYDMRSELVHSGLGAVKEEDVSELSTVFWRVVRALGQLLRKGYVGVEKSANPKTLDAMVEKVRFSGATDQLVYPPSRVDGR